MYEQQMKYISASVTHPDSEKEVEYIFIFPNFINHNRFAENMRRMRDSSSYGRDQFMDFRIVGAGFTDGKQCWGPSHNHTKFDDYVNDVYRRSLCNKYYAEYGQIYTIEIDSLKTCLELQAQGKFKDIDALWTCSPTTKLKLTEINMEDLRPFNWASIEMM